MISPQRKSRPAIIVDDRLPDIEYEPDRFFEPCMKCDKAVLLTDPYEPEYCCGGHMCGCYGMPINPVFCPECEGAVFDDPLPEPVKAISGERITDEDYLPVPELKDDEE